MPRFLSFTILVTPSGLNTAVIVLPVHVFTFFVFSYLPSSRSLVHAFRSVQAKLVGGRCLAESKRCGFVLLLPRGPKSVFFVFLVVFAYQSERFATPPFPRLEILEHFGRIWLIFCFKNRFVKLLGDPTHCLRTCRARRFHDAVIAIAFGFVLRW